MYKILIKYTSTSLKIFWQSHMVTNEEGEIIEFETDNVDKLKEELNNLDKIYGHNNLRVVTDISYTMVVDMPNSLVSVASPEEVSNIYDTAFVNVFGGE